MRLYFLIIFLMTSAAAKGQIRYSLLFNLGQLPYQCFELDAIISLPDKSVQFLAGFNYTNAYINGNKKRYRNDFDERYQKTKNEFLRGPGYAAQIRWRLNQVVKEGTISSYIGLGINQYYYKGNYYENEYVYQAPFYHYQLVEYTYQFVRTHIGPQLLFVFNQKKFTAEIGAGVNYAIAKIPFDVDSNRKLSLYRLDYGYSGYVPAFNLKIGYNFN